MRVNLFGVGTKSESPAITAQRRINCLVEARREPDRTQFALISRPGLTSFDVTTFGSLPSRGLWPVNTLAIPLLFTVHGGTLYSVTSGDTVATIGTIGTTSGDVSMVDNGTYLVLVDGSAGYYYNMITPAGLIKITDGNFTTSPTTVTWQDTFFIVTSGSTNQFQLSAASDPTTWPAVNINFTGAAPGAIQAGVSNHSILNLFGRFFTEFWQDTGGPDFPFALIPGASQAFGLAAPFSLAPYDNSIAGVFVNPQGWNTIAKMRGFALQKIADHDMDEILGGYTTVADCQGFAFTVGGHSMYMANFPTADDSWMYDSVHNVWSEVQDTAGKRFWGKKFAFFVNSLIVSDYRNGNLYKLSEATYTDNGSTFPMEIWSRHIWNDDKYIGIGQIQIDVESGSGLVTGQGSNPVMDLQVSKDGGNSFYSVGFSSMGAIGQYTTRVIWSSLGAARDWVLKLRITDPIHRVITGASAEIVGGAF